MWVFQNERFCEKDRPSKGESTSCRYTGGLSGRLHH